MKIKTTSLMTTSAPSALLHPATMSPVERAAGRFLRAPDGHDAGSGGGDAGADAGGADAGAQGADGKDAGAGAGDAGAGADAGSGGDAGADAGKDGDAGKDVAGDDTGSIAGSAGDKGDADAGKDAADGDGKKDDDVAAVALLGAPDGDYEVKAPEGMEFDQAAFDAVKDDFKSLNLSNEGAQKIVDLYAGKVLPLLTERAKTAQADQQTADMAKLKKEWGDATRADPVLGGAKFQETVDRIGRVWDKLGVKKGEGARAVLDDSGLGNHPDIVKLLAFTGATLEEAKFELPSGGGADNRPIWDKVYGQPEPAK